MAGQRQWHPSAAMVPRSSHHPSTSDCWVMGRSILGSIAEDNKDLIVPGRSSTSLMRSHALPTVSSPDAPAISSIGGGFLALLLNVFGHCMERRRAAPWTSNTVQSEEGSK